jgi:hypothetical protein
MGKVSAAFGRRFHFEFVQARPEAAAIYDGDGEGE